MNHLLKLIHSAPNINIKFITILFLAITLFVLQVNNAFGQSRPTQAQIVFKLASPAVVMIKVVTQDGSRQGSAVAMRNSISIESFKPDGTIFYTNWHVIQKAKSLSITLSGIQYELEVMHADSQLDMAIVKAPGLVIAPVKISLTPPNIGDTVYAIGNPRGLEASISQGIVSGLRQNDESNLIQTTAPISPGSSGGGLFDNEGKLLGITTLRLGNPVEALNFAISAISFEQFRDATIASRKIIALLESFYRNADKRIATARSSGFIRWLSHPERQKIRRYLARDYDVDFKSLGINKGIANVINATDKVLD